MAKLKMALCGLLVALGSGLRRAEPSAVGRLSKVSPLGPVPNGPEMLAMIHWMKLWASAGVVPSGGAQRELSLARRRRRERLH
jgi:hypothetical protein